MTSPVSRARELLCSGIADVLRAAANDDRVEILRVLRERERARGPAMTISDVAAATELDRFAASRHLGILRSAGLVTRDECGAAALHRLRPEAFEALEDWLLEFLGGDMPGPAGQPLLNAASQDRISA